jgi:glyoxylate/hydroxypyruvate reductase
MNIVVDIPNYEPHRWLEPIQRALSEHRVFDAADLNGVGLHSIDAAVVGWSDSYRLDRFPNLRFIQSTFMGVDRLLRDPTIDPAVPIARMVDPDMPVSMTESVLAHVLFAHRQLDVYRRQQSDAEWIERDQPLARDVTVAVLGMGELGRMAAAALRSVGFRVVGLSRTGAAVDGVEVSTSIDTVLSHANIVVNLLPLTDETIGILCARTFAMLPVGSVIINLARGAHLVDTDLLDALSRGHIRHAILDVFTTEPLPAVHRFWHHPQVTVTPHMAAMSTPESCVPVIVENLRRFDRGEHPLHLVDRNIGY